MRIAIRIATGSVIVAIVRDVRHTAAASHRVRVLPDSAGSVVLGRAAGAARSDSARAIDQGRAVAPVVPVRARVRARGVGLARVADGSEAGSPFS